MTKKRIFTHVSPKAVEGIRRLSMNSQVHVLAAPGAGGFTVVTFSDDGARQSIRNNRSQTAGQVDR